MIGHGEKLSRKQEGAIAALLSCPTIPEAAQAAGIGEATMHRWLRLSAFRAAYRTARREVVEHAIGALQNATSEAVATLRRNLTCGSPSVEVQAARAIADLAIKAVEIQNLTERVEALEQEKENAQNLAA